MASLLCPSSIAKPGAKLFGIQNASGHVEYLDEPITVDKTFVETARQGRAPEERFRFATNCIKTGCGHWTGEATGCGLVNKIVDGMNRNAEATLVACPIRDRCRWYHQQGATACASCDEVVRNVRVAAVLA
ncbi:hypothetical protein GGR92_004014 [Spirosoma lacussanchae]|uniref:hypothetical protein n=1 Tax=Spirosoma lacussanchae TaxID=1884249 RepID=UPI00110815AF|nr:hypothetical protein [Spirosoma lacussanchae]